MAGFANHVLGFLIASQVRESRFPRLHTKPKLFGYNTDIAYSNYFGENKCLYNNYCQ